MCAQFLYLCVYTLVFVDVATIVVFAGTTFAGGGGGVVIVIVVAWLRCFFLILFY